MTCLTMVLIFRRILSFAVYFKDCLSSAHSYDNNSIGLLSCDYEDIGNNKIKTRRETKEFDAKPPRKGFRF